MIIPSHDRIRVVPVFPTVVGDLSFDAVVESAVISFEMLSVVTFFEFLGAKNPTKFTYVGRCVKDKNRRKYNVKAIVR